MHEIQLSEVRSNPRVFAAAMLFIAGVVCGVAQFFVDPGSRLGVLHVGEGLILMAVVVLSIDAIIRRRRSTEDDE